MFCTDKEGTCGVVPGWAVPKGKAAEECMPDIERAIGFIPYAEEAFAWERLKAAKWYHRNAIGMPDDLALMDQLRSIFRTLNG